LAIEGNTDSVGSDAMNQVLSEKRASSVMDYLAAQNIPAASMTSQTFRQDSTRCIQRYARRAATKPPRNRHNESGPYLKVSR
jgi:hypothetical protein